MFPDYRPTLTHLTACWNPLNNQFFQEISNESDKGSGKSSFQKTSIIHDKRFFISLVRNFLEKIDYLENYSMLLIQKNFTPSTCKHI